MFAHCIPGQKQWVNKNPPSQKYFEKILDSDSDDDENKERENVTDCGIQRCVLEELFHFRTYLKEITIRPAPIAYEKYLIEACE